MNLARSSLVGQAAQTCNVREYYNIGSAEAFIVIGKDGIEYFDIWSVPTPADITTLGASLGEGHYNTITFTPPATDMNAQPSVTSAQLV